MYIPRADVALQHLQPWTVSVPPMVLQSVGWSYDDPLPAFEAIRAHLSFYPGRIECYLDGIRVKGQAGGFYGGWISPELVGPFKGEPGTGDW